MARRVAYLNAKVYTFDKSGSSATAFGISEGRFEAVGPDSYVLDRMGSGSKVVDLGGAPVIPGLVDAHVHLIDYGLMMQTTADLVGCRSVAEVQERLRKHQELYQPSAANGRWLMGHGFDQELFDNPVFPTRQDLDAVSTVVPVAISRICGHASVGNSVALSLADGPLPEAGRATGLVTEDDCGLLYSKTPEPTAAEIDRAIMEAGNTAAGMGLTGVHCLISDLAHLDRLNALHKEHKLPLRFRAQIPYRTMEKLAGEGLATGSGDEWLSIGSAKIFVDGSFGARTAAMIDDYADDPGNTGDLLIELAELAEMVKRAQALGFQTAVHAIGDRAVETTVSAIEAALGGGSNRLRHRVEHASQMTEGSLRRMALYNIPAAVQPQFVQTDFWTNKRVGPERYRWSYPFRTMLSTGVPLAMSSDCYVERLDPYELIYRALVRDADSRTESLTPEQTVLCYTMGSAYAGMSEDNCGSIEEGKLADCVALDTDIFHCEPDEILNARPVMTIIGGSLCGASGAA